MNGLAVFFNQYGAYLFIALFVVDVVFLILYISMRKRISSVFRGESLNIEDVLRSMQNHHDGLKEVVEEHGGRITAIEELVPKDLSKIGLIRFNPFSDAGGDQSFALALLNRESSGVVISSLYGREMSRMYAKPVEKGASRYQLSEEERQAIEQAVSA